ncbi:MAG: hypothetical protein FJ096_04740 [Deltaproteobacteria bacterium]|nr:hypothetical protein [Deltaproteobacteria bacterium]
MIGIKDIFNHASAVSARRAGLVRGLDPELPPLGSALGPARRSVEKLWCGWPIGRFSTASSLALGALTLITVTASEALAADPNAEVPKRERRGGLTFGVALGPMAGSARGYPNDLKTIGRPESLTETGFSAGGAGSGWLGITFNDYLSFGLAGYGGAMSSAQHLTRTTAFAFRVEAYPAYALGGPFRDLGLSVESGIGVASTTLHDGGAKVIESGAASRVALGAFWEGVRLWKLGMGPFVSADLLWGSPMFRGATWLGWRTSLTLDP